MKKQTILLCGGGGYIGSVLAEALLARGYRVTIFDRFFFGRDILEPLASHEDLTLVRGDVRSVDATLFSDVAAVVHLAGLSNDPSCDINPSVTREINVVGTLRVAEAAKRAGVGRFIFSSSCSVYGGGGENSNEDSALHPVSLYAELKAEAEERLRELSDETFAVTVLRNATVYGLSYRMRFDLAVNLMTLSAFRSRKIYVTGGGRQWRPFVHVRDVARAFIATLDAPAERVGEKTFNVGANDQNYQILRLANVIAEVVPGTEVDVVPDDADKRSYSVSFDRIERELDFRCEEPILRSAETILAALKDWRVEDQLRTRTVAYYKYLIEAERVIREVSYQGRIL